MIICIIANHNYGRFLKDAIDSALSVKEIDLVYVVDNGSTDNSLEILESYDTTKFDKRFRFESHKDGLGPAKARNLGIQKFLGNKSVDHFIILDADDTLRSDIVEKKLPYFEDESVGVVYSNYNHLYPDGTKRKEFKFSYDYFHLQKDCILPNSSTMVSAECLRFILTKYGQIYPEDMRVAEDYHLWLRIAEHYNIMHCPEFLCDVRWHPDNCTNSLDKSVWHENWTKIHQLRRVLSNGK